MGNENVGIIFGEWREHKRLVFITALMGPLSISAFGRVEDVRDDIVTFSFGTPATDSLVARFEEWGFTYKKTPGAEFMDHKYEIEASLEGLYAGMSLSLFSLISHP